MRAQSTLLVASIFVALVILSVIPLVTYINTLYLSTGESHENVAMTQDSLISETAGVDALLDLDRLVLFLISRAKQKVTITGIILSVACSEGRYHVRIHQRTEIYPGQTIPVTLTPTSIGRCSKIESMNSYIETESGSIVKAKTISQEDILRYYHETNSSFVATTRGISILPISVERNENISSISLYGLKGFMFYTLDRIDRPTKLLPYTDISKGMKGGNSSTGYIWRLHRVFHNTDVRISNQSIRNLWLGFDPRNSSAYNLLITCDNITISTPSVSTSNYTRIKIYGFRPSTSSGILQLGSMWIRTPSQDVADYTFNNSALSLSGFADRLEVYIRVPSNSETGYDPYTLLMNTNGALGRAELLFTTIDRGYGSQNTINDGISSSDSTLLDYSTSSLALSYRGFPISNEEFVSLTIAINYAFHDNEGADERGTTMDLPIFIVGLVDESDNIYYYRAFTYRELARYEDTLPPTAQAQSTLLFVPLPPAQVSRKTFYVFIAIQDPYSVVSSPGTSLYTDDVDFTLYIRSLDLIPAR